MKKLNPTCTNTISIYLPLDSTSRWIKWQP